jgi:hypothetical protein
MKKLFSTILVLSLLLSGNAYAKCIKGNCKNGYGTWKNPNGNTWQGTWKNSKLHGLINEFYIKKNLNIKILYENGKRVLIPINEEDISIHNQISKKPIIKINVQIYIVQEYNPMNREEIEKQIEDANKVWKQANIYLNLISVKKFSIEPEIYKKSVQWLDTHCTPISSCLDNPNSKNYNQAWKLYDDLFPKRAFNKNALNVYYLPYKKLVKRLGSSMIRHKYCCKKNIKMPKNAGYILIASKGNFKAFDRKPLAHEIGHQFSLGHTKKGLMYLPPNKVNLTLTEVIKARKYSKINF